MTRCTVASSQSDEPPIQKNGEKELWLTYQTAKENGDCAGIGKNNATFTLLQSVVLGD